MLPFLPDQFDISRPRCTANETALAGSRAFVLDNGIFRLSILPEFGGRLVSLFYRPLNLELLATEFLHGPRKTMNVHGGWCAAFPSLLADGEILTHLGWDAEIVEQSDERVSVRMHCLVERVSHELEGKMRVTPGMILVERYVSLVAGEAAVTVEDVLTNRNVWPMATTWCCVVALRAQAGDRAVAPVEKVEVQRGVGPSGNELDFGLLVATPYQAFADHLSEGWLGFHPVAAPVDLRLSFPKQLLPHAVIAAQRDEQRPDEGVFRFQPMATCGPVATDARDGALILPPKQPVHLPVRLELGAGIITSGAWSRPGLQLAEMIVAQRVPTGRLAVWRAGDAAIVLKTPHELLFLLPEFAEDTLLNPEDLPAADLLLFSGAPPRETLRRVVQRTSARCIGPASLRYTLRTDGVGDDRSIALSPGARVDLPGLGMLATPVRNADPQEQLGFLVQSDHLLIYHIGPSQFLGEFGPIGEQFHPQLLFLPLAGMSMADCIHAAKQLQPRLVVPLGTEEAEVTFIKRCRDQHMPFATQCLGRAEGRLFDGWHLGPLG